MARTLRGVAAAFAAGLALTLALGTVVNAADWTSPERVSEDSGSQLSALHELAGTRTALHLVHGRLGPEQRDDRLVYQRSANGGARWTVEQMLFRSTRDRRILVPNFAVAAAGDLVVAAWRARGAEGVSLFVRRSTDGGRTWEPRQRLATSARARGIGVPAVAVTGQTLVAAWTSRGTGEVLLRRSIDQGATWTAPRRLGTSQLSIECGSAVLDGLVGLAATGDTVHLAWSDGAAGSCIADALLTRTSLDGGETWRKRRTASTQRTFGWPEVTARGRRLLMSLQRPDGGFVVVRSRDTGVSFAERSFEVAGDRALGAPDVLMPRFRVAWLVFSDITYDGAEVATSRLRFRASADHGVTWGPSEDVVPTRDRLRQAANLVAWGDHPVVAFQSSSTDGTRPNIFVSRAR